MPTKMPKELGEVIMSAFVEKDRWCLGWVVAKKAGDRALKIFELLPSDMQILSAIKADHWVLTIPSAKCRNVTLTG